MSSWGNNDNAANTPLWSAMSVKRKPDSSNTTALFDNVTANTFITGRTDGVFGVDASEASVAHGGVHTGWVLKTTGQGGRAGRVTQEVLVAMNTIKGDADAQIYANVTISLVSTLAKSVVANTLYANAATFTVTPTLKGNTAATLTYQWQVNNAAGSLGWTNVVNATPANTHYTNGTTATLSVLPYDTTASTYKFRAIVTAADQGVVATSSNSTITVA